VNYRVTASMQITLDYNSYGKFLSIVESDGEEAGLAAAIADGAHIELGMFTHDVIDPLDYADAGRMPS